MNCSAIEQNKIIQNLSTTTDQKVSSDTKHHFTFSAVLFLVANLLVNSIIIKKLKDYNETVLADEHFWTAIIGWIDENMMVLSIKSSQNKE